MIVTVSSGECEGSNKMLPLNWLERSKTLCKISMSTTTIAITVVMTGYDYHYLGGDGWLDFSKWF